MVPVLKRLKVWTLYVHVVAQVNHRGLGVKVETNCLRDSDQIPRQYHLLVMCLLYYDCVFRGYCAD